MKKILEYSIYIGLCVIVIWACSFCFSRSHVHVHHGGAPLYVYEEHIYEQ